MNSGWISLHRKIKKHWIWQDSFYLKLWIDFLMRANHQDNKILFDGKLIDIKKGSFVTSQLKLASEYKCSREKIRNFLKLLKNEKMITIKTTNKTTNINICNYEEYQETKPTDSTTGVPPGVPPEKHQKNTENNYNNENNDNNLTDYQQKSKLIESWKSMFNTNPEVRTLSLMESYLNKYGFDFVNLAILSIPNAEEITEPFIYFRQMLKHKIEEIKPVKEILGGWGDGF